MREKFGATSTTNDVLSGADLTGKRILVTGASSGLGVETCRALVAHGADVVGAVRDLEKAKRTTHAVSSAATASGSDFRLVELDLASLTSVRRCADALQADGAEFDSVIANAGVMATPSGRTADGFETQFGTNHLGHFVFVNRVAPLLRDGGRVVVLSSLGHRFGDVDLDDPGFARTPYDSRLAYSRSKTANVLFAVEFDRRHRRAGRRATAVHPGAIMETDLARHMSADDVRAMLENVSRRSTGTGTPALFMKSIPQGAATSVWAAVVATADAVGGRYCEDCHVAQVVDGEGLAGVSPYAIDPERARSLWALSESMVGETFASGPTHG
jgi:NAD(P)-dependent dehydrogenase (short-subunit alcohol dehydrogenase family)